ncbi:hypothetical protein HU200_028373 [Digitaria exilis]|uniref:Pectinesterase inhibitor domain-containing protein n=1 Tax=Digitaria exilis TaxID=1010633 RepID=A0A835EVG3_9POAL|nr:hypothetical protein HU200_028373 [Digitaria exilis]
MATTTKPLVLIFMALLPLTTLGSRAGPSPHHSHSPKRPSPPPPSSSSPPPPPPSPAQPTTLVRATCNSTTYPDLCVSTLLADPSSATADVRGLSAIAVTAAAANASGGAATAAALANANVNATANASSGDDATVQALLRTCTAKYGDARDALAAARGSIATQDYDYASVHVSAAAEYPRVCRVLFQRQRPGAYPAELATREEALRQLCTVSLDIITLLFTNSSN